MTETTPKPRDLLVVAFVRTFWTVLIILGVLLPGLVLLWPPSYESEAKIELLPNPTNAIAVIGGPDAPDQSRQWLSVEGAFLYSRENLKAVAEDLHLSDKWGKKYNNGAPLSFNDTLSMLIGRTDIRSRRGAAVMTVKAYSDSPDEAAQIANSLIENYGSNFQEQRRVSSRILQWAHASTTPVRPRYVPDIIAAIVWSIVYALLAATTASGIVVLVRRLRTRTVLAAPSETKSCPRFQKY